MESMILVHCLHAYTCFAAQVRDVQSFAKCGLLDDEDDAALACGTCMFSRQPGIPAMSGNQNNSGFTINRTYLINPGSQL